MIVQRVRSGTLGGGRDGRGSGPPSIDQLPYAVVTGRCLLTVWVAVTTFLGETEVAIYYF